MSDPTTALPRCCQTVWQLGKLRHGAGGAGSCVSPPVPSPPDPPPAALPVGTTPAAKMSSKRAKAKTTKKRPQRATSNVFAMFDQSQIQEFKEAFNMIDQNRDGFIDKEDLHDMLASLGKRILPLCPTRPSAPCPQGLLCERGELLADLVPPTQC